MIRSKGRIALLTAGLKPENFERASERVLKNSLTLYDFDARLNLRVEALEAYCPKTFQKYKTFLNPTVKGFGFWAWKPEFIYRVAIGQFGQFDQVVWIDSGCEINANIISKQIFAKRIEITENTGYWLHALNSSDKQYSKKNVISQFPKLRESQLRSPQIQANYLHLSTQKALPMIEEWFTKSIENISNIDLNSDLNQDESFIEHRSDQSLLSLIMKNNNVSYSRINLPNGRSVKSSFRGIFQPVWISRNRDGKSIIPKLISRIP